MRFKINMGLLITTLLFFCGCSSVRVSQDYQKNVDFATLKTYAWQSERQEKTGDLRLDSSLRDDRIRRAVAQVLSQKGFQLVSGEKPDFYVAYQEKIYNRVEVDNTGAGFAFGMGSGGSFGGIGISTGSHAGEYDEIMTVIDVIDTYNGDLLWRGNGSRTYVPHDDPQQTTAKIDETVQKILTQFPPK